MPVETFTPSTSATPKAHYRQVISPHYLRGSFTEDTLNHDFVADAQGKGRFTIAVATTGTSTYLASVYGMHDSTFTVGALGVFPISTGLLVTSTGFYETVADPFPYYLVRITTSDTGDTATPTISVFGNFSAY